MEYGTLVDMRPPTFVRPWGEEERTALERGSCAAGAFVPRCCQIRLASARGERAPRSAVYVGIDEQAVLDAVQAFNANGLERPLKGSSRPKRARVVFGTEQAEQRQRWATADDRSLHPSAAGR